MAGVSVCKRYCDVTFLESQLCVFFTCMWMCCWAAKLGLLRGDASVAIKDRGLSISEFALVGYSSLRV